MQDILITGISSDIGRTVVAALARDAGVHILGTMRRTRPGRLRFAKCVTVLDQCDLTQAACCERLACAAEKRFRGPFGFVHCVGDFWDHVPFLEYDTESAEKMFSSHVITFYNALRAIVPLMVRNGGGSTISFSCNSTRYSYPWMTAFTASKSATDSMVRSLANEHAGQGLRFNSLVLSSVQTEKVRKSKPHGDFAHFIRATDLVPVIRFLMSEEGRLVNGNNINMFEYSAEFYSSGYFERVAK